VSGRVKMPTNKKKKQKEKHHSKEAARRDKEEKSFDFESFQKDLKKTDGVNILLNKARKIEEKRVQREHKEILFKEHRKTAECDGLSCEKFGKLICSTCGCRAYCGVECQLKDWPGHKIFCKRLKACAAAPLLKPDEFEQEVFGGYYVHLGVTNTKRHGTHIYCMEMYEKYGSESNRLIPLASIEASNTEPTEEEVVECLVDSILYPEFDSLGSGPRRLVRVRVIVPTFPSKEFANKIATYVSRLGCKAEVGKSEKIIPNDGEWEESWFYVQMGWNEEITNTKFLAKVEEGRRHPMRCNGSARKSIKEGTKKQNKIAKNVPAEIFPSRNEVLKLPFLSDFVLYIGVHQGILYAFDHNNVCICNRPVAINKSGRPALDNVLDMIYKACKSRRRRPGLICLGQPSIASLRDVCQYERALDCSICEVDCRLARNQNLEEVLHSCVPHWKLGYRNEAC